MKKLTTILMVFALAVCLLATAALADGTSISVSSASAAQGDDVTISVSVSGNTGFSYCRGSVSYDSAALQLTGLSGNLMAGATTNPATGLISFASATNVVGDGVLFTATFKILDSAAAGASTVSVSATMRAADGTYLMNETTASGTVSITCIHSWGDWQVTQAPTCTEAGVETRTCTKCGEKETRSVAATGHTWGAWEVTTEPTCTEKGVETRTCTKCGATETRDVAAIGHTWGAWEVTTAPTCTETGVETRTCTKCGEKETRSVAATGHTWGEWEVTTAPTCEETGVETRTCTKCDEKETREVAAIGHKWDEAGAKVTKNATTTTKGEKTVLCLNDPTHTKIVEFDAIYDTKLTFNDVTAADKTALVDAVKAAGYSEGNVALYDVILTVSFDDGATATEAEALPSDSVSVTFPYPSGTNAANYDFVIFHLRADGTVEKLTPTEGADGLTVKVSSLLPFAITWKQVSGGNQGSGNNGAGGKKDSVPKMGEPNYIALVVVVIALGATGLVVFSKKKHGQKNI